jgi:adenylate cyclase
VICAGCGHENRPGKRFCTRCGAALSLACPGCGSAVEADERFCGDCGAPLTAAEPAGGSNSAAVPVAGERKHITVLFADVAGSMDLQERLDSEVWAEIMGRFVSILADGVRRFGGTVDKFTGDGIMALFGAPTAQEDHARRACHAAWHLLREIGGYSEELRRTHGVALHVRLGLNSGEVVVGRVGADVTLDPTALGHTVGLAQRMEAMAEPGTAKLSESTARLVEGWFRVDDLGAQSVKGSRDAVRVYALQEPAVSPPILRGSRILGTAPLVGRQGELALLEDALSLADAGSAQVVGVVGEAGVGKSRLCDDFVRRVMARGFTVRRAAGVSHGRDIPLLPILALLRDYFGIADTDRPDEARARIATVLTGLDPALADSLPLLYDFLEVPDPDRPAAKLAPEVRMHRLFETLQVVTRRRSARETLVLLVEDLHWFDPHSAAFLERLIESFPGSRTLVLTNFRPEFSAAWMRHSYYRQLALAALSDEAVSELVGGLLGADLTLAPLLALVLDTTRGNPFFVEEVIRSLVQDGTLAGQPGEWHLSRPLERIELPPSVQAVVAARIDSLPPRHKSVLQIASVVGRTFRTAVVGTVAGLDEQALGEVLQQLCSVELVQPATGDADGEFRFWHPLTQEVAYRSMLSPARAGLHGAVARTIVDLDSHRLDERAPLVAAHLEAAGEMLEAARWHIRAAAHTARTDVHDAVRRWRGALTLLETAPEDDDGLRLGVTARIRLAQYGAKTGVSADEVAALLAEANAVAERLGDFRLLTPVSLFRFVRLMLAAEFVDAAAEIAVTTDLAAHVDDVGLRAGVWMDRALLATWTGPVDDGLRWADKTIGLCAGDHQAGVGDWGYSPLRSARRSRAVLLALGGRLDEAFRELDGLLADARDDAGYEILSWALSTYPGIVDAAGIDRDTTDLAAEAMKLTEDAGNWAWHTFAATARGLADIHAGRWRQAVEVLTRTLDDGRTRGIRIQDGRIHALLARARMLGGDGPGARQAADEAVTAATGQGAAVTACLALLTRARVLRLSAAAGNADQVEADLDAAGRLAGQVGARVYEPQLLEERAELRGDEGLLRDAVDAYAAIGATGHARRLRMRLSGRASSAT